MELSKAQELVPPTQPQNDQNLQNSPENGQTLIENEVEIQVEILQKRNSLSMKFLSQWNDMFMSLLSTPLAKNQPAVPLVLSDQSLSKDELENYGKSLLNASLRDDLEPPSSLDHLFALAEGFACHLAKQMDYESYNNFTKRVNVATINWLHSLLRLPRTTKGYYRTTTQRARLLLSKLAIVDYYPNYPAEGFHSFGDTTPLIFASRSWFWLEELRFDLGLPLKSILIFKDIAHLESLVQEFSAPDSSYRPFMLVGSTGGWKEDFVGDDVVQLVRIATKYKLWSHIEGNGIFSLAASEQNEKQNEIYDAIVHADSILFNAFSIFGYPDQNKFLPTVFYNSDRLRKPEEQIPTDTSILDSQMVKPVEHGALTLQLWFAFQHAGKLNVKNKITKTIELCERLYEKLSKIPSISIITPPHSLVVAFQYKPLKNSENPDELFESSFIEKVNQQVYQDVVSSTSASELDLELVSTTQDSCDHFLFNPFHSPNIEGMEFSLIDIFTANLNLETELINTTLTQRNYFRQLIWANVDKGLYNVEVPNFIGLGAVKYIPPIVLTGQIPVPTVPPSPSSAPVVLGPKLQEEIDRLNEMLATKLSGYKSIFQNGRDILGRQCVLLGVDTGSSMHKLDSEVKEEISLNSLENCSKYIDTILEAAKNAEKEFDFSKQIGKIIESGIKEAEERLKKEQERLEQEQGLIRKIPIVGSVWNWWSPATAPKGNTFSLLTTEVQPVNLKPASIKKPSFESIPNHNESHVHLSQTEHQVPVELEQPVQN